MGQGMDEMVIAAVQSAARELGVVARIEKDDDDFMAAIYPRADCYEVSLMVGVMGDVAIPVARYVVWTGTGLVETRIAADVLDRAKSSGYLDGQRKYSVEDLPALTRAMRAFMAAASGR